MNHKKKGMPLFAAFFILLSWGSFQIASTNGQTYAQVTPQTTRHLAGAGSPVGAPSSPNPRLNSVLWWFSDGT